MDQLRRGKESSVAVLDVMERMLLSLHPHRVWRAGMRQRSHRRVNDGQREPEHADEMTSHT
jgi:hypothetical protein